MTPTAQQVIMGMRGLVMALNSLDSKSDEPKSKQFFEGIARKPLKIAIGLEDGSQFEWEVKLKLIKKS